MCIIPEVEELILKDGDTAAVDLETYDPDLKDKGSGVLRDVGFVCGIAVATDTQTLYFPIRHNIDKDKQQDKEYGKNLPPQETWDKLNKGLFQNPTIKKVFHNAMYDVWWIRKETGLMPKGELLDTMIAASVIDANRLSYSLDSVSRTYLKEHKYKYDLKEKSEAHPYYIKDPMSNMHRLPYDLVKDYAHQDVNLTLKLWKLFDNKIKKGFYFNYGYKPFNKSLSKIFQLETDLFPCLVDM